MYLLRPWPNKVRVIDRLYPLLRSIIVTIHIPYIYIINIRKYMHITHLRTLTYIKH